MIVFVMISFELWFTDLTYKKTREIEWYSKSTYILSIRYYHLKKNPRNRFKMGNNFSKRNFLIDEKANLVQEMDLINSNRRLTKNEQKNLKTFQSMGDLVVIEKDGFLRYCPTEKSKPGFGRGYSKYWSFLPRL